MANTPKRKRAKHATTAEPESAAKRTSKAAPAKDTVSREADAKDTKKSSPKKPARKRTAKAPAREKRAPAKPAAKKKTAKTTPTIQAPKPKTAPKLPPTTIPINEIEKLEVVAERAIPSELEAKTHEADPIFADGEVQPNDHNQYLHPGIPPMYVIMITPELSSAAKVGGLADVVSGLSRELQHRGNTVEIILPKYDCLKWGNIYGLEPCYSDLWVPWFDGAIHCTVYQGFVYGRKCFFVEPHSKEKFFERGVVYGEPDDVMRFAFFSRAAMEFLHKSGKHPEIIHVHDWQTALVPVLLYEVYQHMGMSHSRACFTIHNFRHQGVCGPAVFAATKLDRPEYYANDTRLGWVHPGSFNLMKGGIVYSNFVNTVSPTYAGEVRDHGGAFGLEGTLGIHSVKFGGILNGIDYDTWNPEIDAHIPKKYSVDTLDQKHLNKKALRERLLLADNDKPIVAYIGRLDPQKGLDLVRHALFYTVNHGAQFVLLGSGAERSIDEYFLRIKYEINDNSDSHLEIGFDEDLARLIYAGADMLVVPSRFEPCGLTQLISMRYGTIPIVRAVGGLADTVFDKDYSERPLHERNGYVFHNDDDLGIESALARAISCYYMFPDHFRQLMQNAMRWDYSWNVPGQHYLNVYDFVRDK